MARAWRGHVLFPLGSQSAPRPAWANPRGLRCLIYTGGSDAQPPPPPADITRARAPGVGKPPAGRAPRRQWSRVTPERSPFVADIWWQTSWWQTSWCQIACSQASRCHIFVHTKERKTTKWLWEAAPEAPPGNKKKLGSSDRRRRRRKNITELETNVTTRLLFTQEWRGTHHPTEYPGAQGTSSRAGRCARLRVWPTQTTVRPPRPAADPVAPPRPAERHHPRPPSPAAEDPPPERRP
eukprot:gene24446-biopygen10433